MSNHVVLNLACYDELSSKVRRLGVLAEALDDSEGEARDLAAKKLADKTQELVSFWGLSVATTPYPPQHIKYYAQPYFGDIGISPYGPNYPW